VIYGNPLGLRTTELLTMSETDAALARTHNESSIVFTLPPELRNLVYEYAVTHEQGVHAQTTFSGQPILILVSHQGLITEANLLK
jgi:hypothetical protein